MGRPVWGGGEGGVRWCWSRRWWWWWLCTGQWSLAHSLPVSSAVQGSRALGRGGDGRCSPASSPSGSVQQSRAPVLQKQPIRNAPATTARATRPHVWVCARVARFLFATREAVTTAAVVEVLSAHPLHFSGTAARVPSHPPPLPIAPTHHPVEPPFISPDTTSQDGARPTGEAETQPERHGTRIGWA